MCVSVCECVRVCLKILKQYLQFVRWLFSVTVLLIIVCVCACVRACVCACVRVCVLQLDLSTPLHLASTQGAIEAVKLMLSSYGDVENIINLTDGACQTPLHR